MTTPVTKAIIPVAGLGTRVLPASKAVPKEMMPIVDKPVIQYVVEEAIDAGIKQIILVTRSGKSAVENHFDSNYELEKELARKGKQYLLDSIINVIPDDVQVVAIRQAHTLGLGHAIHCAASLIGDDPFAVLLPDIVIESPTTKQSDMRSMMQRYRETGMGQIMVERVPPEKTHKYGVIDCAGKDLKPGDSAPLKALVEKPAPGEAPSNFAINGRYILPGKIMSLLEDLPRGADNEIQLTDAMQAYLKANKGNLMAYKMHGINHDCGNKFGYFKACVAFAIRHSEIGEEATEYMRAISKQWV